MGFSLGRCLIIKRCSHDNYVDNFKLLRGRFLFSTWTRNIISEVLFLLHVESVSRPREEYLFLTWIFRNSSVEIGIYTVRSPPQRCLRHGHKLPIDCSEIVTAG